MRVFSWSQIAMSSSTLATMRCCSILGGITKTRFEIAPKNKLVTPILASVDCVGCNDNQQRPVSQVICKHGDFRCSTSFDADRIANNILEII